MADNTPNSNGKSGAGHGSTPGWVKIFGIVALVLALLFLVLHLTGRSLGDPMQHLSVPEHKAQQH